MKTNYAPHECLRIHQEALQEGIKEVFFSSLLAVEQLLGGSAQKKDWSLVAETFNWENVPDVFLRAIALKIYNLEHGNIILIPILNLNVLHLEDFEAMTEDMENVSSSLQWEITLAVYAAAKHADRFDDGVRIVHAIQPFMAKNHGCLNYRAADYRLYDV